MAKKNSTGKSGSGNPDAKKPPEGKGGEGGGDTEDDSEDEDDDQTDDGGTEDGKGGEGGDGKSKDGAGDGKGGEPDLSKLPEDAQAYIKKLRRENAKHRTKAGNLEKEHQQLTQRLKTLAGGKDGDDDGLTPEQRIEKSVAQNQSLAFDNAILQSALQHGIGSDGLKYFRYLVQERVSELGEGEELDDEDLAEIAAEAQKTTGSKGGAKTSVDGKGGNKNPDKKPAVTLDQFAKMSVFEKSDLQKQNPDLYAQLFKEAREKRKFV